MDKNLRKIYTNLKTLIKDVRCELNYSNIYELLIAVVLSAQCTDKRVNMVTVELFNKYPTVYDLANAEVDKVEKIIHSLGTYKIKSKNIINLSKDIVSKYNGQVPNTIDELTTLPGVGRKTASVVLAEGYKIPAFPVDTHILRVANRLGLVKTDNPDMVEKEMKKLFPKEYWIELHQLLVLFGRYHCKAIGYRCNNCIMQDCCKFSKTN